jgi:hypothetical protein
MKNSLSIAVLAVTLCAGLSFSQNPSNPPTPSGPAADHKVEILEKDLVATRQRVETLSAEVSELRATLEATSKYLADQAASAKNMSKTLDDSETAGFTYGINPDSRHILLKGWRDQLQAMQKDVPKPPARPGSPGSPGSNGSPADSKPAPGH